MIGYNFINYVVAKHSAICSICKAFTNSYFIIYKVASSVQKKNKQIELKSLKAVQSAKHSSFIMQNER